jgi:hypothetical protein
LVIGSESERSEKRSDGDDDGNGSGGCGDGDVTWIRHWRSDVCPCGGGGGEIGDDGEGLVTWRSHWRKRKKGWGLDLDLENGGGDVGRKIWIRLLSSWIWERTRNFFPSHCRPWMHTLMSFSWRRPRWGEEKETLLIHPEKSWP